MKKEVLEDEAVIHHISCAAEDDFITPALDVSGIYEILERNVWVMIRKLGFAHLLIYY